MTRNPAARYLALLILLAGLWSAPGAAAQRNVVVTMPEVTLEVGETITVEGTINCNEFECTSFDFALQFDPTIIRVDEVDPVPNFPPAMLILPPPANTIDNDAGLIRVAAISTNNAIDFESDVLVRITLTGLVAGVTTLNITGLQVIDANASPLFVRGVNGRVTVADTAATPPTETPTQAPTSAPTPIDDPLGLPGSPVTSNDAWTPRFESFDGIQMALVPVGCFMMGSDDGDSDEQPVAEICFDEPFWIDRYEVSNGQFDTLGGFATADGDVTERQHPRDTVTWFEALDFCELRGGRLPTEAEWEYAARGPDSLVFPWGDAFDPERVVFFENTDRESMAVGSRPAGASWVGALDLSGNVTEWTSTTYDQGRYPYPYVADDGREEVNMDPRSARGGSWNSRDAFSLRAAFRGDWIEPDFPFGFYGFRCARDWDG
ncbi:MAG: SUMF1/EgtB/PvdO family nonheme iron enzyme [Chloroflexi bacterium]|nr:SUMF1/EgtB/PvdO family nonheme iron enzyme [Chloroflexota bacterium]